MNEQDETVGRAIWESQRSKIKDPEGINARLTWRSSAAPDRFWDSYIADAEAAIAAIARCK